jgi:hypothetical protein
MDIKSLIKIKINNIKFTKTNFKIGINIKNNKL